MGKSSGYAKADHGTATPGHSLSLAVRCCCRGNPNRDRQEAAKMNDETR
jgi:hypothetical protein